MKIQNAGKSLFGVICAGVVGAMVISTGVYSQQGPFGSEGDVSYASELWKELNRLGLAGKNPISSRPYEGTDPHGAVLQTLKTRLTMRGQEGEVIVKRNFKPVALNEVFSNPDNHLVAVTVMFKREAGYDPNAQDWFWAKYNPDGSLDEVKGMKMAGKVAGCISCHKGAAGGDFVYTNDK